jgi:hypothetical protein
VLLQLAKRFRRTILAFDNQPLTRPVMEALRDKILPFDTAIARFPSDVDDLGALTAEQAEGWFENERR